MFAGSQTGLPSIESTQAGGIADWADSIEGNPVWDPANIDVPTMVFHSD